MPVQDKKIKASKYLKIIDRKINESTNEPMRALTIITLFKWNKCCKCNMEFRREFGYKDSGFRFSKYLCSDCGINGWWAHELFGILSEKEIHLKKNNV